jgi:hypothetical protein
MTNDKDETAKYILYILDADDTQQDGIEVAATMRSLEISLHQMVLGNDEATPSYIAYYMRHVNGLLRFAHTQGTMSKLQRLLETLDEAKSTLEQDEDAESQLRNAWQLMRRVLSLEEIEKIPASQVALQLSGTDQIIVSGLDAWEQANRILHSWSTQENEDQRVEYIISYSDGFTDGRWLNLPLFYKMDGAGEDFRIGPALELGNQIIAVLEKSIDLGSEHEASFDAARDAALVYLRHYAVGGACNEAVTTAILRIQNEQWSPGIVYRRSLHSEKHQREGSL